METLQKFEPVTLTAHDRCDKCNAQARVIATRGDSMLYFCSHHGHEYFVILLAQGWDVQNDFFDERT